MWANLAPPLCSPTNIDLVRCTAHKQTDWSHRCHLCNYCRLHNLNHPASFWQSKLFWHSELWDSHRYSFCCAGCVALELKQNNNNISITSLNFFRLTLMSLRNDLTQCWFKVTLAISSNDLTPVPPWCRQCKQDGHTSSLLCCTNTFCWELGRLM